MREGDEGPTGPGADRGGARGVPAAVADGDRLARIAGPRPGAARALACGWWTTTGGSSGVYVKINPDGTVALNTGAAEIGTAALTGAAQVLAEELGVDLADINVVSADTSRRRSTSAPRAAGPRSPSATRAGPPRPISSAQLFDPGRRAARRRRTRSRCATSTSSAADGRVSLAELARASRRWRAAG